MSKVSPIHIYTDGSCHTASKTGAWAALLLLPSGIVKIQGIVYDTTHNRMELEAVLQAVHYLKENELNYSELSVFSDSQYVVRLDERREKLKKQNFRTKKGNAIRNEILVRRLIQILESEPIHFIKVQAHQKKSTIVNYNREVDILVRQVLRQQIKSNANK